MKGSSCMNLKPAADIKFFTQTAKRYGICNKSERLRLFFDFIYCKQRFHCKLSEYFEYDYFKYKNRYRKYFLTSYTRRSAYLLINRAKFTESKLFCYELLKKYYSRKIFGLDKLGKEGFVQFLRENKTVVLKPDKGSYGIGVESLSYTCDEDACRKYDELYGKDLICEEFIRQHETVSKLCPTSVNSCRIMTLLDGGKTKIIAATLKMSKGANFVDNMRSDGIGANVDLSTGVIVSCGKDFEGNRFIFHPLTGVCIPGTQLPFWQEALYIVSEAHKQIPECSILGWDIAFTQTGVDIVEVNSAPGSKIHQFIDKKPKGKPIFEFVAKKENRRYKIKNNNYEM